MLFYKVCRLMCQIGFGHLAVIYREKRLCERIFVTGVQQGFFVCVYLRMGCAHVAQLVERILGKDEVSSSTLLMGSINLV